MTSTIDAPEATSARRGPRWSAGQGSGPGRGASTRQRRLPWVALGVLLLVMSTLGFALWSIGQAARTPVLVAGAPIEAGAEIQRDDLILVAVGPTPVSPSSAATSSTRWWARSPAAPSPAGTPLSPALVVSPAELVPAGQAVVGASLAPGEYPTSALRAGDRVRLIATGLDEEMFLAEASVWAVEPLVNTVSQELFVSLLVDEADAAVVADAAADEGLHLVLVGNG